MRSLLLAPLLALSLISNTLAATSKDAEAVNRALLLRADSKAAASPADDPVVAGKTDDPPVTDGGNSDKGTIFNGHSVPPLTELSGETIDSDIAKGYWLVEFFSPYCHHCKAFAPTWETLYEFYYTSDPVAASVDSTDSAKSLNSFTRYYDFKFAKLDCVAFGTACSDHGIHSFPTVVLFKDGVKVKDNVGAKDLKFMSNWVEETLETIRPGSRVKDGPKLPKVGANKVEGAESSKAGADKVEAAEKPKVGTDKVEGTEKGAEKPKVGAEKPAAGPAKEKDVLATTSTTSATSTKTALAATRIPKETPNTSGKSVSLTAENFQRLVTTTHDPWFVKFYAPWCHHCQAMAPNWQGMARDMKGKLNVGEVNCELEKRLCKDVHVKGFPTLIYFQGGERVEYDGLRGLGDLIKFANQAVASADGVIDVNAAQFEELEKTEEVLFLYFYDHATTSEDFEALERLTLSLIGHAKLVKSQDPVLCNRFKITTWPRLLVSRDGKPTYYTVLSPREMRDFRRVLGWMQSVWLPIVPELTASNAREIMDGKLVVLGILSRERSDEFIIARREIKNAALEWIDKQTQAFQLERQELRDAKQLRIEEAEDRNDQRALRAAKQIRISMDDIDHKEVGFAWVDGVFWERWIKTTFGISVKDGEKVVINDEDNQRYWDNTITGNPIVPSRTSILETLPKVVASPPKISPKNKNSFFGHLLFTIRTGCANHPIISLAFAIGAFAGVAIWARGQARKGRAFGQGGFFQLGEGNGKEGLLGNTEAGGKVD